MRHLRDLTLGFLLILLDQQSAKHEVQPIVLSEEARGNLIIDNPLFEEEHQRLVAVLLVLQNLTVADSLVFQLLNRILFNLFDSFEECLYVDVEAANATFWLHVVQVVDGILWRGLHEE